jgi:hypothetical protein
MTAPLHQQQTFIPHPIAPDAAASEQRRLSPDQHAIMQQQQAMLHQYATANNGSVPPQMQPQQFTHGFYRGF